MSHRLRKATIETAARVRPSRDCEHCRGNRILRPKVRYYVTDQPVRFVHRSVSGTGIIPCEDQAI